MMQKSRCFRDQGLNINAYHDEDQMKATLIEGSVKVKTKNAEVLLNPSEQAVVTNHDNQSISKLTVQTDEVTAWKNGFFQFDRASYPCRDAPIIQMVRC